MIDHDRLFKELLTTFFWEFLQLFFPDVAAYVEQDSITFLDKEIFTDVTAGAKYEADFVANVKFREQDAYFLIHLEHQAQPPTEFGKRMFRYFARLHETYDRPIYPIALFSFAEPQTWQPTGYHVTFPNKTVLEFHYDVIQLNRLNWRDFLQQQNPVASALMARMKIAPGERLRVKVECLRLLATLRLNPAKMQLISGFIDTYLRLNAADQQSFRAELAKIEPETQEVVMQIVTSWMEEGIQQGLHQGRQEGRQEGRRDEALRMLLRQGDRRFGALTNDRRSQIRSLALLHIEDLADALWDLTTLEDLDRWLQDLTTQLDRLTQQVIAQIGEVPPERVLRLQQLSSSQRDALIAVLPSFTQGAQLETWLEAQQRLEEELFA